MIRGSTQQNRPPVFEFDPMIFTHGKDFWMAEWTGHNAIYNYFYWTPIGENVAHVDLNEEEIIPWDIIW